MILKQITDIKDAYAHDLLLLDIVKNIDKKIWFGFQRVMI